LKHLFSQSKQLYWFTALRARNEVALIFTTLRANRGCSALLVKALLVKAFIFTTLATNCGCSALILKKFIFKALHFKAIRFKALHVTRGCRK
jgi:hypothetical protein